MSAVDVDREKVAGRLLSGSVKRSYEPVVDMDWDAPLDDEKLFLPERIVSLAGTPLWDMMSADQRRELSRQELANLLSVGIWFENVLGRLLLREIVDEDPTSKHAHYALTELGDECRHMVMFGRLIDRIGARAYWPRDAAGSVLKALPAFIRGSMVWTGTLLGEEIFDALQRKMLAGDDLQPLVARMMRIHVTEEGRHIQFARHALARDVETASRTDLAYARMSVTATGPVFVDLLTNRWVYQKVGLDGAAAKRVAKSNEHFRAALSDGASSLAAFLDEVGLLTARGKVSWRRAGLIS